MASEDVIDLGSSDEEGEPAQKRMKPMPNAMVHIPEKVRGVTIKPCGTTSSAPRLVSNPFRISTPAKINGRSANKNVTKPVVNPAALLKNLKNSQLSIQKVSQPVIKVQNVRSLNRLPPSITVKRTTSNNPNVKRIQPINLPIRVTPPKLLHPAKVSQAMKRRLNAQANNSEVLTVELDDDDSSSSNSGPQWYLRPEEQNQSNIDNKETCNEKENNSEPGSDKMIEITIEDSPIKAIPPKKSHEVGAVLEITIDDSPVKKKPAKATSTETVTSPSSSGENKPEKECHSKKKLVYPSKEKSPNREEIPIEPMDVDIPVVSNAEKNTDKSTEETLSKKEKSSCDDNIIIISESPLKKPEGSDNQDSDPGTSNKESSKLKPMKPMDIESNSNKTWDGEFHPTYQKLIDLCFKMEQSADMTKIVESKVKRYYRQVPKYFVECKQFIKLVSSKIAAIEAEPAKMFLFIKDVVDELNIQRKSRPLVANKTDGAPADSDNFYGEYVEYEPKKQRQIRKLEKTLKKLHRAIQKLEEQEVDFDDEDDSVYIQTESEECTSSDKEIDREIEQNRNLLIQRYKERTVKVHAKLCQLTNTRMPSEPRITLEVRPGRPSGPAKRLEKWINKKVPAGETRPFPDFHDVLKCVRDANDSDDLGWNEADIMEEARDLFTRCGKKLQKRRQDNEWRLASTRIAGETDPVDEDGELYKKLEANKKLAAQKEFELFNKYADKQKKMNLEAVEIGDKEANESPDDSEDEPEEAKTAEGTPKRKWKRLICDDYKTSSDSDGKKKSKHEKNEEASENNPENSKPQSDKEDSTSKDTIVIDLELMTEDNETKTNKEEENETKKDTTDLTEDVVEKSKETIKISKDQLNTDKSGDEIILSADEDLLIKQMAEDDSSGDLNPQTISDDSNKMKSDIDEQSLLKKIGSDYVHSSTTESTDSGDGTGYSDANDCKDIGSGDIISIENSSYSESEEIKNKSPVVINSTESTSNEEVETNMDIDNSDLKERVNLNNKKINECIEDILLASSDDEEQPKSSCVDSAEVHNCDTGSSDEVKSKNSPSEDDNVETVNIREDSISIGETVVGDECTDKTGSDQIYNADTSSIESVALENDTVVDILEKDKNKIVTSELNKSENEAVSESKDNNDMLKNGATILESIEVNTDDSKESTECTVINDV